MVILLTVSIIVLSIPGEVCAQYLRVSDNHHFLVNEDGSPFFWLGDTGWELLHRLDKSDTEHYLRNRSGKGFNVVQCVLPGLMGLEVPNQKGELFLDNLDPSKPNEKYFEHVDWVIDKANEFGIKLAILPVWGGQIEEDHPVIRSKKIFDEKTAYIYGVYLGNRYKDRSNIVWVLGGDTKPEGYEKVWENLVKGLKAGGSNHLISYHIYGEMSSSEFWHHSDWLDFNMIQSGHISAFYDNYRLIERDYKLTPPKPVLDGEPIYEGIHIGFARVNGRANDHHVRVEAYWSVFSGGFGYTYGHNSIWQMYSNDRTPLFRAEMTWKEAMEAPGSSQMHHLKNLMLSRPFLSRIPDQSILNPSASRNVDHLQATRDGTPDKKDATYIMVYFPYMTHKYKVKTNAIAASKLRVWWFDPRTGVSFPYGEIDNSGIFEIPWGSNINTNNGGPDWVLVIDDGAKKYPPPGIPIPQKSKVALE